MEPAAAHLPRKNVWDADVALSPEEARALIEGQLPALRPVRLELLGVGWDNTAYRVNEAWVFRFPRRKAAAELIRSEARILPLLAPQLPLPVPVPVHLGAPAGDYPYPFSGYPWLPGRTACRCRWTEAARAALAEPLGRFLAVLHRLPVDPAARAWAPGDDLHRSDLARRAEGVREGLLALAGRVPEVDVHALASRVGELVSAAPHAAPPCWVHGDLYARHLLVDAGRRLGGVIDWGDVHLGDPALDLSIAFTFLPPAARETFRTAYGGVDPATWRRAEFRALHYGVLLTRYGAETGDRSIRALGELALRAGGADDPAKK